MTWAIVLNFPGRTSGTVILMLSEQANSYAMGLQLGTHTSLGIPYEH